MDVDPVNSSAITGSWEHSSVHLPAPLCKTLSSACLCYCDQKRLNSLHQKVDGFFILSFTFFTAAKSINLRIGLARISSSEGNASTWSFPDTAAEWIKYKVFEYLWHQGLFVTPGLKFGGHYLAYPGDPLRYHSHYIVNARDKETPLTPVDLVSMGRLAVNVKKVYVLASPDDSGNINVFSIHWAGF